MTPSTSTRGTSRWPNIWACPLGFLGGPLGGGIGAVPSVLFFIVAGVIFWRRSDNWIGLLVSLALAFIGGIIFTSADDAVARTYPQLDLAMDIVSLFGGISLGALFFLFPDGRFAPRWTRGAVPLFLVATVITTLLSDGSGAVDAISIGITFMFVVAGLYSQIYRYRRVSLPVQRQQTKWIVLGLTAAVALGLVWSVVATAFPPEEPTKARVYALLIAQPIIILLIFVLPLSFAISILRYRLWDMDVLVNRALVYGVLTGTLVGSYFGTVVGLQAAFRALTDQGSGVAP